MDDIRVRATRRTRQPEVPPPEPARAADKLSRWAQFWLFAAVAVAVSVPQGLLWWRTDVGVYADFAALALLLGVAFASERARKLALAASVLPMASIVTLLLPRAPIAAIVTVYYAIILVFALVYRQLFRYEMPDRSETSLSGANFYLIFAAIVFGEILGVAGFFILGHHFAYSGVSWGFAAVAAVVFAVAEELLFQGLIQQLAAKLMHPNLAALLAVVAFACASIGRTTVLTAVFAVLAGTVLAALYLKRPSLILAVITNVLMKLSYIALIVATGAH